MSQDPHDPNGTPPQGYPGSQPTPGGVPGGQQPMPGGYPQSGPSPTPAPGFGAPAGPNFGTPGGPQPQPTPTTPLPPQAPPFAQGHSVPPGAPGMPPGGPGIPPQGGGVPPKKKGKGLMIGLIAGAVALVLIIGGVIVGLVLMNNSNSTSTDPEKVSKSDRAVQGYLDALAAGDAELAKKFALNPPEEAPTLTNEFLSQAVSKNPITEINVEEDEFDSGYIKANYKIGSTTVSTNFQLSKVSDVWKIDNVVISEDRPNSWGKLPVTLNGTELTGSTIALFPGIYTLDAGTKLVTFEKPTITVEEPSPYSSSFIGTTPVVSDEGETAMRSGAKAEFQRCLSVQELAPEGCGNMIVRMPSGITPIKSTITWEPSQADPFANSTPRLDYSDPTRIEMSGYTSITFRCTGSDGRNYRAIVSVSGATGQIKGDELTVTLGR